ncbi:MAG: cyclase family protein [bacterium]|nr:cyclase family protein [bacterium]
MLYDVSLYIEPEMVTWPSDPKVDISLYKDLKSGDSSNVSIIKMGSHTGTHIDAPKHMDINGAGIDELDLECFYGDVTVIEIQAEKSISLNDIQDIELNNIARIIFKTSNSELFPNGIFDKNFIYLDPEAAAHLANNHIRVVGIDAPSIDGYKVAGHPTHSILFKNNIPVIELLDLRNIKPGKYRLIALPLRIRNSDGAPARVILEKNL